MKHCFKISYKKAIQLRIKILNRISIMKVAVLWKIKKYSKKKNGANAKVILRNNNVATPYTLMNLLVNASL